MGRCGRIDTLLQARDEQVCEQYNHRCEDRWRREERLIKESCKAQEGCKVQEGCKLPSRPFSPGWPTLDEEAPLLMGVADIDTILDEAGLVEASGVRRAAPQIA